jgi:hypothetical protein
VRFVGSQPSIGEWERDGEPKFVLSRPSPQKQRRGEGGAPGIGSPCPHQDLGQPSGGAVLKTDGPFPKEGPIGGVIKMVYFTDTVTAVVCVIVPEVPVTVTV